MPRSKTSKPSQKKLLTVAMMTVFLDLIGFGILIPIQPFFALSFGASPSVITLLGASFSLMQFLFVPFWGYVSDRVGRKPVILISVATSAIGFALFGMATSMEMLFIARMISGFGSANIGTAQAIIADSTSSEGRAKGMGLIGVAFGLGFIFGPALGGLFGTFGLAAPAFAAAALSTINFILALVLLPETRWLKSTSSLATEPHSLGEQYSFWEAFHKARKYPNVIKLLSLTLMVSFSFSMLEQSLGLFIQASFVPHAGQHFGALKEAVRLTAYFLVAIGICAATIQGVFIGKLVNRFGEGNLIRFGTFTLIIGLFVIPFVGQLGHFFLMVPVAALIATGTGCTFPSNSSFLSKSVGVNDQGMVLGLGQSLSALGRVIGPSFAGLLFEQLIALPFWVASCGMIFCFLLALRLPTRPSN